MPPIAYPHTRTVDHVDTLHGTPVPDPYRWLEDLDLTSTGIADWLDRQNDLTFSYIREGAAKPIRDRLLKRLTEVWDYPKYGVIKKQGGRYFHWLNTGLQNQPVLYMQASLQEKPVPVLDPNTMSEDGTTAITAQTWSDDGWLLGYALSRAGSDWQELRVRDMETLNELDDVIRHCKFTAPAWKRDQSGFFYSRFPDPTTVPPGQESFNQKVYFHTLQTSQDADSLIYARPDDPELGFTPHVTDDGRYLILHVWRGTDPKNRIYYAPLNAAGAAGGGASAASEAPGESLGIQGSAASPAGPGQRPGNTPSPEDVIRLLDEADARYDFIDNVNSTFYFNTDLDAPRGRVIAIDLAQPDRAHWREVIPQGDDPIDFATIVSNHLVIVTLHHAHHVVKLYTLDDAGKPHGGADDDAGVRRTRGAGAFVRDLPLPGIGSITGLSGKRDDDELFLSFTSFLHPTTVLRYHFPTNTLETVLAPKLPFDPSSYETTQVFYSSKDGTRIPMFLTHKKGLTLNGQNPTLLYGYGGFNISLTPNFSPQRIAWLEAGGVYAVANLRGGGEYGESWHLAGTLLNKQNVFDDFHAAAEWLIHNRYTQSAKLAIQGGSNGGLLVGACLLQRPDLYGAVLCQVPVADMLRYHRFTVGRFWVSDYGNADEDESHFRYQLKYSPVHNCKPGTSYPATLITTADHDDRVAPAHAFKFAAALQSAQSGSAPILLRVDVRAGHGAGKPTTKLIEEQADLYTFLFRSLNIS